MTYAARHEVAGVEVVKGQGAGLVDFVGETAISGVQEENVPLLTRDEWRKTLRTLQSEVDYLPHNPNTNGHTNHLFQAPENLLERLAANDLSIATCPTDMLVEFAHLAVARTQYPIGAMLSEYVFGNRTPNMPEGMIASAMYNYCQGKLELAEQPELFIPPGLVDKTFYDTVQPDHTQNETVAAQMQLMTAVRYQTRAYALAGMADDEIAGQLMSIAYNFTATYQHGAMLDRLLPTELFWFYASFWSAHRNTDVPEIVDKLAVAETEIAHIIGGPLAASTRAYLLRTAQDEGVLTAKCCNSVAAAACIKFN